MNVSKRMPSKAYCETLAPNLLTTEGEMMPDLVLYDDTKLYIIITYPKLNKEACTQHLLSTRPHTHFVWTREDINRYYEKCATTYGSDVALCLLNLFSEVRTRCSNFHLHYKGCPEDPEKNRAFHTVLLASDAHATVLRQTIRVREEAYRTQMGKNGQDASHLHITELLIDTQPAYSMPLPFFYEFSNLISFGWQIGIVDEKGSLLERDTHAKI